MLLATNTPIPIAPAAQLLRQGSAQVSESPIMLLGKRGAEGERRPSSNSRGPSRYRGITHHLRTNRYEAHVWQQGKQCYLGGFYVEEVAALSYDLASIKFRGEDAVTNFDAELYRAEMQDDQMSPADVVQCLRNQSKAMNRLDTIGSVGMEGWELAISEALQQDKYEHVGVYCSEVEAARAYDRALIRRRGVAAATNFPLANYIDQLSAQQVGEALALGLIPPVVAASFAPSPVPAPLFSVAGAADAAAVAAHGDSCIPLVDAAPHALPPIITVCQPSSAYPLSSTGTVQSCTAGAVASASEVAAGHNGSSAFAGAALQLQLPVVHRKQSATPKSVMDFEAASAADWAAEQDHLAKLSGKPTCDDPTPQKKLRRTEPQHVNAEIEEGERQGKLEL